MKSAQLTNFSARCMFKNAIGGAVTLITVGLTLPAFAQAPPTYIVAPTPIPNDECASAYAAIQADIKGMAGICTGEEMKTAEGRESCLLRKQKCDSQESQAGAAVAASSTGEQGCDAITSLGCPEAGGTYANTRQDRDDARRDVDDAQKDLDTSNKANLDASNQAQQQLNQLSQQAQQENQNYMQQSLQASQKLQDTMMKAQSDRAKLVQDLQQKYDEINAHYVELRDDMRKKATAVASATLKWNTDCRADATAAQKDAEKAADARIAADAKLKINYAMNSSAGRNMRVLKKRRQEILDAYNTMLLRCMAGSDGRGTDDKLALDQAQHAQTDSTASDNDHAAVLETQRQNLLSDMNTQSNLLQQQLALAVQQSTQNQMMLQYTHEQSQAMSTQQIQQAQQQAVQAQMFSQQQSQHANQRLQNAQNDAALASGRLQCASNMSNEDASAARTARRTGEQSINALAQDCNSYCSGDCTAAHSSPKACPNRTDTAGNSPYPDQPVCNTPAVKKASVAIKNNVYTLLGGAPYASTDQPTRDVASPATDDSTPAPAADTPTAASKKISN